MPRNDLIQPRAGTAAQWALVNPVLAVREWAVETDGGREKYGDGVTAYNDLPYAAGGGAAPEYAIFSGTGAGVTDYSPNDLTCVAETDPQDWWSLAGRTITFPDTCHLTLWFEVGGEFIYAGPVTEPDIYYKGILVGEVANSTFQAGQVMPDGSGTITPDPAIRGAYVNGVGVVAPVSPGATMTFTGEAGSNEEADGVANFAFRCMVVRVATAPTFPA